MVAQSASVAGLVARRARFADLVILPKPYGEGQYADAPVVVEAAMFQGNAPAIVLAEGRAGAAQAQARGRSQWNDVPGPRRWSRSAVPLPILQAATR